MLCWCLITESQAIFAVPDRLCIPRCLNDRRSWTAGGLTQNEREKLHFCRSTGFGVKTARQYFVGCYFHKWLGKQSEWSSKTAKPVLGPDQMYSAPFIMFSMGVSILKAANEHTVCSF